MTVKRKSPTSKGLHIMQQFTLGFKIIPLQDQITKTIACLGA